MVNRDLKVVAKLSPGLHKMTDHRSGKKRVNLTAATLCLEFANILRARLKFVAERRGPKFANILQFRKIFEILEDRNCEDLVVMNL